MTNELFTQKYGAPEGFIQPNILSECPPDTPMLVAFSGGADSRLLLELAVAYGRAYDAPVYAAHLHHGIRHEEADRDEAFCRRVAAVLDIPLFVEHVDIPALAAASGRSLEWEAREVRYAFFARIMNENAIPLLLTAHHADDQLETLLLRMMRGTGTKGIGGIPSVRPVEGVPHGLLLRPMLSCTKTSILNACRDMGLDFVTDSTNQQTDAARNYIRHEIIPAMERLAGNGTPQRGADRLARLAREDHAYLCQQGHILYEQAHVAPAVLSSELLCQAHPAVAKRALAEAYFDLPAHEKDGLSSAHLEALLSLCHKKIHGSVVALPHGVVGIICDDTLCFLPQGSTYMPLPSPVRLDTGDTLWDGGRMIIRTERLPVPAEPLQGDNILASAVFPMDKLSLPLWARPRQAGDILRHHGVGRKLKKLLCDKNIPPSLRDRIPLICLPDMTPLWFPTAGFADGFPPPTEGCAIRITVWTVSDET